MRAANAHRSFLAAALVLAGCAASADSAAPPPPTGSTTVVQASEVVWEQLNPARGDQSPRAGTLWGDRHGEVATGYLLRPVDGFVSPPHIHNVTYRAVVLRGLLHNDDPTAERQWMPAGSFWTQPKGAVHITAAQGPDTLAYIEIDEGPYLVHPPGQAFATGEVPVNVDPSNVVWLDADAVRGVAEQGGAAGVRVAFLWGEPSGDRPAGAFVELPPGFDGSLRGVDRLRAVVIAGAVELAGAEGSTALEPGSYLGSTGPTAHGVSCRSAEPCLLYLRTRGGFSVAGGEATATTPRR